MDGTELLIGTIVLAVGTYAFRLAGPLLRERVKLSPRAERLMVLGAVVLLAALVAVSALTEGHSFRASPGRRGCWSGSAGLAQGPVRGGRRRGRRDGRAAAPRRRPLTHRSCRFGRRTPARWP